MQGRHGHLSAEPIPGLASGLCRHRHRPQTDPPLSAPIQLR